jgi:steroid delta-isomerase-like uncharacterized protein
MPVDANETLARRFLDDVWTDGRYDVADLLLAPDHRHHISGDTLVGPDAVKEMARYLRGAFPDLTFVIEDAVVDGDKVLLRWTARGTHAGTFGGVEGTGRRVEWTGMDLVRCADGRIVELWGNNDAQGLWEQIE